MDTLFFEKAQPNLVNVQCTQCTSNFCETKVRSIFVYMMIRRTHITRPQNKSLFIRENDNQIKKKPAGFV